MDRNATQESAVTDGAADCRDTQGNCCGSATAGNTARKAPPASTSPASAPAAGAVCTDDGGCGCKTTIIAFDGTKPAYIRRLWVVIAINATMFVAEMTAGVLARSQALKADALDFLGDTLTYGLSLAVIGRPLRLRARVAMFKALTLFLMGLWVLLETLHHVLVLKAPVAPVMGGMALAALLANLASVILLLPYRDGDANVRSVWLCSRNDALGNLGVLLAAWLVWLTGSAWPDIVVAIIMAALFTHSSLRILKQARAELALAAGGT